MTLCRALALALMLSCAVAFSACGREEPSPLIETPNVPAPPSAKTPPVPPGGESAATKNTARIAADGAPALAAGAARAVFPAETADTRPSVVALADGQDWQAALAATSLMGAPLRAPLLLSDGAELPDVSAEALDKLAPTGSTEARDAQVIRVGDAPRPEGFRSTDLTASGGPGIAAAIDSFLTSARGAPSQRVVVVGADDPAFAMPAAAWAAKSGDPILFVGRNAIPAETTAALRARRSPRIFILGPVAAVGAGVERELRRLGTVTRVDGADPVRNAIAFSRFSDGEFGWGIKDPGHGLVFARADRPADAAAAAVLSAAGTYGPLLLLDPPGRLPDPVRNYLLDIQPGYQDDPVRGVYNHGWILGTTALISAVTQAEIDTALEIAPVAEQPEATSTTPGTTPTSPSTTTTVPTTTTSPPPQL